MLHSHLAKTFRGVLGVLSCVLSPYCQGFYASKGFSTVLPSPLIEKQLPFILSLM